jgi:hypothetical protein
MKTRYLIFLILFCINFPLLVSGQEISKKAEISFKKGIGITAPDSSFSVNFRFRMQNRVVYNTISENNFSEANIEARVRRLRLRMEGFIFSAKLSYLVQLGFSRGDLDWNGNQNPGINENPNILRDAVLCYKPGKIFTFVFGQTKLPVNRQRVVSSGDLQFLDRSIVNNSFNVDRDFGFQVFSQFQTGNFCYVLKGAVTSGEGRNTTISYPGLAYTGRVELLPLGKFSQNGDYFEGDLERETSVKISLAGGLSFNDDARRTGGQVGQDLFAARNITTYFFDGLLKFRGFALSAEHMIRDSPDPITRNSNGDIRYIMTGKGSMVQTSYLFKNNYEIAAQYAAVNPDSKISNLQYGEIVYTCGVNKYLRKHRLKLQGNLSLHKVGNTEKVAARDYWSIGAQIELGI